MDSTFIGWIMLWVSAFAIQAVLYAKFARKHWSFVVALTRNVAMILTWLPLLFLVKDFDVQLIVQYLPFIAITALAWWLHLYSEIESSTYLPVGISKVLHTAWRAICIFILSLLILNESYTWYQRLWVALTLVWWFWLGFNKIDISHLRKQSTWKWILLALFAWIFSALWRYFYKFYADILDNFLAVYILEASIWVFLLIFAVWRMLFAKKRTDENDILTKPTFKDMFLMALISLVPFMWSLGVTFAFETWWYGLTTMLIVLSIPLTILFAYLIFKEKITKDQILPIVISLVWLAVIRFFW